MNRAYSVLTIKSVDEDQRIITGVATTPTPDRVGDVVEPLGVEFKNPMPLLWQHRSDQPVGTVKFDKPTKAGITFTARIASLSEPGTLKDRLDEAWQSVKLGLVRAVSIGFRAIEFAFMDGGGIRFTQSEVLELSLVTIPAQADAKIETIKSIDAPVLLEAGLVPDRPLAASGRRPPAGVTVKSTQPGQEAKHAMKKTITEQIAEFEATRAAKAARMEEIMNSASESGETLNAEQTEEYDNLESEVKSVDAHLVRLRAMEEANRKRALAVSGKSAEEASKSREGAVSVTVRKPDLPKGTAFTRFVLANMRAKGNRMEALDIAKQWHDTPEVALALTVDIPSTMKAAVGVGTTTDATWASPLIAYTQMQSEFIELLRPATIIGRIPGLRRVPFNIQMPRTTTGSSVGWVGENAPKPVSSMAFDTVTLRWAKAAGIIVLTEELVRFSSPSAEAVVRDDLVNAMAQFLDRDFVDPSKAEVTNVSPASITNGVSAVTPSGTTASAFRADVKTLFANYLAANMTTTGGVWIMTQSQALSLSLMQNTLGQPVFPTMTPEGGFLLGYPVIASENIPSTSGSPVEGYPIIFAKASEIMLADDGQTVIDASREASVQMDTAPDSPPSASTNMVSLWQMNMMGLRAERWINWKKRRSAAVQYIQNAKYAE